MTEEYDIVTELREMERRHTLDNRSENPLNKNTDQVTSITVNGEYQDSNDNLQDLVNENFLNENVLQNIFNSSPLVIIIVDKQGKVKKWNKTSEELFGWNAREVIGSYNPIIPQDMKDIYFSSIKKDVKNIEMKAFTKKGTSVDILFSSNQIFNDQDKPIGAIIVITDISERKEAEVELSKQINKTNLLNHIISEGIIANNVTDYLENTLDIVLNKIDFDAGGIYLLNKVDRSASIVCSKNLNVEFLNLIKTISIDNSPVYEQLFNRKEMVILENYDQKFPDHASISGFKSVISIPIEVNNSVFGAFNLGCTTYNLIDENDIDLLKSVTSQMGMVIERIKSEVELKENAEELEMMNRELHVIREQLTDLNLNLEYKVEERTKEVQKLIDLKDEFINQLGHDLKTPITPLNTLLPIVQKRCTDEQINEMLTVCIDKVRYMKELVIKTLELARINSPTFHIDLTEINLFDLLDKIIQSGSFDYENCDIVIENQIPKSYTVKADALRFEELMNNLISNAIRYSPEGGRITIDAEETNDHMIRIGLHDSGIGLTSEQLEHIFDEFYKADESRHDFSSTGLGLSICRKIIEKHNGTIWADSEGIGKGSSFYFTIPKIQ